VSPRRQAAHRVRVVFEVGGIDDCTPLESATSLEEAAYAIPATGIPSERVVLARALEIPVPEIVDSHDPLGPSGPTGRLCQRPGTDTRDENPHLEAATHPDAAILPCPAPLPP
jgi:hypothetical protein